MTDPIREASTDTPEEILAKALRECSPVAIDRIGAAWLAESCCKALSQAGLITPGWSSDMEAAPKDGTGFWGYIPGRAVSQEQMFYDKGANDWGQDCAHKWACGVNETGLRSWPAKAPTHWRPLPQPPETDND